MRPLRLLHTADVHLGLSDAGTHGREEAAFSAAIDLAIERHVDVLLIAGDLFDHARVSDDLLAWTAKELDRLQRPVVLLVGNHDALHDESVHHRFRAAERCAQVQLLDAHEGSIVDVPGTDLVVWGRAMREHVPSFRPLAGVPAKPDGRWGVVAGHGNPLLRDKPSHHGSPIAPAEIEAIDWDYIALGHHHGFRVLRDAPQPAVYPGALARARKGEPGVVLAEFSTSAGVSYSWTPLSL
jgi:DNA repair exonuclease SbcCD nuclease subunit